MKSKVLLLITMLSLSIISGCNPSEDTKTTYIEQISVGEYRLWESDSAEEYLNFLSIFDNESYEIVNIDTLIRETGSSYNNDYFMITYKRIK